MDLFVTSRYDPAQEIERMTRHTQSFPTDREAGVLRIFLRHTSLDKPWLIRQQIIVYMPIKRQHEWLTQIVDSLETRRLIDRELRPHSMTAYQFRLTDWGRIVAEAAEKGKIS